MCCDRGAPCPFFVRLFACKGGLNLTHKLISSKLKVRPGEQTRGWPSSVGRGIEKKQTEECKSDIPTTTIVGEDALSYRMEKPRTFYASKIVSEMMLGSLAQNHPKNGPCFCFLLQNMSAYPQRPCVCLNRGCPFSYSQSVSFVA